MSDAGFELRPWVSLPMGQTIERASERAIRRGFDDRAQHPSVHAATPFAMIWSDVGDVRSAVGARRGALLALTSPAGAAEVARGDGWRLDARDDERSSFCLRLTEADSQLGGGGSGTCGLAPWRQGRSQLIAWVSGSELVVAGAVPRP